MENLWSKIDIYVAQNNMIYQGDILLAAVSGGVDSMCMLHYLLEKKEKLGIRLAVFHFNHHLRNEAGEDAEFVRLFCDKNNIPFIGAEGNVLKEATSKGLSIEEAARILRYNAMFECAAGLENDKTDADGDKKRVVLAFAHNAGDRAETVLFRLFRGTGLKGLRGIEPVSLQKGYRIIRPLLECSREDIELCMKQIAGGWVEDITNGGDEYTRNKIRHHIISYAKQNINAKSIENICRAAVDATDAYNYILAQTRQAYQKCLLSYNGRATLDIDVFLTNDEYLQKHILLYFLEQKTVARKDLTSDHINDMLGVIRRNGNKRVHLPFGLEAVKEYNCFYLENGGDVAARGECMTINTVGNIDWQSIEIKQEVFEYKEGMEIPTATYTKWLDYDRIQNRIEIRSRRQGDYLYIDDKGNRVSLKKYFINEKIPPSIRDKVVLVADGNHVLWVVGYRISALMKITSNTKKILELNAVNRH